MIKGKEIPFLYHRYISDIYTSLSINVVAKWKGLKNPQQRKKNVMQVTHSEWHWSEKLRATHVIVICKFWY